MTLIMERTPAPEILATIGQVKPKSPAEIRTLVLNAVGEGFNTIRALREKTKLDDETIIRELDVLKNLLVVFLPGPPVTSYWLVGKVPKNGVYLTDEGCAVAHPGDKRNIVKQKFRAKSAPAAPAKTPPEEKDNETETALPDETPGELSPTAAADNNSDDYREIPINLLDAHAENPRGTVDEDDQEFLDLVEAIRAVGVQQPLVVTPIPGTNRYRVVIGHRRKAAASRAGRETVPCVVRFFASAEIEEDVMLIENIQRQDLKPVQEARAFKRIYDREGKDINRVARRLGLTQSFIAGRMKLLLLDVGIQIMVDRGELNLTTAGILAELNHDKQRKLLPRAQRMKTDDLRLLAQKYKRVHDTKIPAVRQNQIREKRVTTDEEKFTRTGAIKTLDEMGDAAWVSVGFLKRAFDDICIDSCLESKDETICNGCPVPRFIHALTRHKTRSENQ